jgi:hypothetical protein
MTLIIRLTEVRAPVVPVLRSTGSWSGRTLAGLWLFLELTFFFFQF